MTVKDEKKSKGSGKPKKKIPNVGFGTPTPAERPARPPKKNK